MNYNWGLSVDANYISQLIDDFESSNLVLMVLRVDDLALELRKVIPKYSFSSRYVSQSSTVNRTSTNEQPKENFTLHVKASERIVRSPVLGFIRIPHDSSEIKVLYIGATFEKGDVVAYVDVLGTQYPVSIDTKCRVKKIYCNADEMVEYRQELFDIEVVA